MSMVEGIEGVDPDDYNGYSLDDVPLEAWAAEASVIHLDNGKTLEVGAITWERLSNVDMRSIVFLDRPLLQADAFHLVAGRKGQGKGTILSEIASRVTRGELGPKRNVVWIGSEDSAGIDIKPRIVAAGGEAERVLVVKDGFIQLPRDVAVIAQTIVEFGDVGMLVIDPVGNHIEGTDSDTEKVRFAINPLNKIADEHRCMVFGVRHLSEKDCSKGVLAAILGSSAWVQTPRAVLAVVKDDEDGGLSHFQCVAGNRLPPGSSGRMFRIEGVMLDGLEEEVTRAVWTGESGKDVETIWASSTPGEKAPSRSGEASELILDVLDAEGDQESDALDARIAAEFGISAKTVRNLRGKLTNDGLIKATKHGLTGIWTVHRTQAPRP